MNETTPQGAFESAIQLFAKDRASQSLGMVLVSVAPGAAEVTMTVRPEMANGHGICHGGLIFALADSAFAFACNSHGTPTVAASATIDFVAPARVGEELTARARELWRGRRTGLYDIVVTGGSDAVVAHARGRSYCIATAIEPEMGT